MKEVRVFTISWQMEPKHNLNCFITSVIITFEQKFQAPFNPSFENRKFPAPALSNNKDSIFLAFQTLNRFFIRPKKLFWRKRCRLKTNAELSDTIFFAANSFLNPNRSFCCDTFLCLNSFQIFSHSSTSCFFVSRRKCFETLKNFSFAAAFQKKVSTWNWKLKACLHYVLLIEKNCLFSLACSVSVCNTKPASTRAKMQRTKLHLKTAMGQNVLQLRTCLYCSQTFREKGAWDQLGKMQNKLEANENTDTVLSTTETKVYWLY